MNTKIIIIIGLLFPIAAFSQSQPLSMEQAVQVALQQNKGLKSADASVAYYRGLTRTSGELPKTQVGLQYGQNNSYANDNNFSVSQSIPFPTLFGAKKQLNEAQVESAVWQKATTQNDLIYQVKQTYIQLLYLRELRTLLTRQDSLFTSFERTADLRYRTGESRMLEKTAATGRLQEVRNLLRQNQADEKIYMARLQSLLGSTESVDITGTDIPETVFQAPQDSVAISDNPQLHYLRQQVTIADRQKKVYSAAILPDITVGYFNQTLIGMALNASGSPLATGSNRFQGFQVGVALPLWLGPMKARVKAEEKQQQAASLAFDNSQLVLQNQYRQAVQQFVKFRSSLDYYHATALPNADLLLQQATKSYTSGDIGYAEYFLNLEQVLNVRQGYLQARNDIKQAELYIAYLSGRQR
ncbi:MAG TPA: TolC family protein [Chitinophaga sp.]|uniref:TolC family protein n=1 Tax=Chitinophaga sp. TaxID=1869181 RepID=UPI002CFC30DA|nr:TolC family protein [Chitinophaga sp.]HVI47942.1 TolC family protein [Chitinophaga sp.]